MYYQKYKKWIWVIISIIIAVILNALRDFDDTDDAVNRKRSGFILYTDYGTGCQYLGRVSDRGITPRLDKNGHIICGATQKYIQE